MHFFQRLTANPKFNVGTALGGAQKESCRQGRSAGEKKEPAAAGKMEKVFSLAEFQSLLRNAKLDIPDRSIRKGYKALDQLRKNKNLTWDKMRQKAHALSNGLQVEVVEKMGANPKPPASR